MDQDQGVGREVRRLREAKGWSQTRLATEASMSVSGVSMIENGHRNLSTTTLAKLAEALEVGVRDLFPLGQAPLPDLEDEQREPNETLPSAGTVYTAYEALGHVLAGYWREDLAEWDEKPEDSEEVVWGLLAWVSGMSSTTAAFTAVAREAGFRDRPEFREALADMDAAKAAGLAKAARILKRIKTDVEFHRILAKSGLLEELQIDG